jgi:hypothetical protein
LPDLLNSPDHVQETRKKKKKKLPIFLQSPEEIVFSQLENFPSFVCFAFVPCHKTENMQKARSSFLRMRNFDWFVLQICDASCVSFCVFDAADDDDAGVS